ncbi:hypothetical protein L195_g045180 [Trifolium pratense]|uniref:Uncharacterized protein n=1 Tax=Trifolium pratense TaxID=57577 RepID=A0A2K3ME48_TRIPR|nr:hypothetical protein L195_g045180 [Trifolium pratense]
MVGEAGICSYLGGEVLPCSADMDVVGQAIVNLEGVGGGGDNDFLPGRRNGWRSVA